MTAIPQPAFAKVMRSARAKDRNIDIGFSELFFTGYLRKNLPFNLPPLKSKGEGKSILQIPQTNIGFGQLTCRATGRHRQNTPFLFVK